VKQLLNNDIIVDVLKIAMVQHQANKVDIVGLGDVGSCVAFD
jgi:hypothetical protein